MGIWMELGIFIVVLIWGAWQWHDARKALATTRADKQKPSSLDPTITDKDIT
jgi:hypothetical protein